MTAATTPAVPRTRDRDGSEARMRAAAATLFDRYGYDHVTVRMIAAEAGVNVALVNRYFGSKLGLFTAAYEAEAQSPDLDGVPLEEIPRFLAEHIFRPRPDRPMLRAMVRSTGSPEVREVLRRRLEEHMVARLAARLGARDARARAQLATSLMMGASMGRTVFGKDAMPAEDLVPRLAAVLELCLFAGDGEQAQ